MAKKIEEFPFDDDFFNSLDDDTGTGGFGGNNKKSSGRKAITEFGGSFLSGVKKALLNPSVQRNIISRALPEGYTAAFDTTHSVKDNSREIFDEVSTIVKKQVSDSSDDLKRLNASYGKYLPKGLKSRLDRKLEEYTGGGYTAPSEESELEGTLDGLMAEMVSVQKTAARLSANEQKESTDKLLAGQMTSTAAISLSNRILKNISANSDRVTGINTTLGKLSRKQVEITFKQYMLQRKTLDVLEQTREMQKEAFASLIKNTGLPEAVKITLWENASQSFRGKMVGIATERMTAKFEPLMAEMFKGIKAKSKDRIESLMMLADLGLMGASSMNDAAEFSGGRGKMAASGAGEFATGFLAKKLGTKLGKVFQNNPKLKAQSDMVLNLMDSAPGLFEKLMKEQNGLTNFISMIGADGALKNIQKEKPTVRRSGLAHLDDVVSFNRRTELALTEVIPGWLGKIHHELAVMRSGDLSIAMQQYDHETGTFVDRQDLVDRAQKVAFNQQGIKEARSKAHKIINQLDKNKQLSKPDREALMRYIIGEANRDTGNIDLNALMSEDESPLKRIDPGAARRVAEMLKSEDNFNREARVNKLHSPSLLGNVNSDGDYQSRLRTANKDLEAIRRSLPNGMQMAVSQASVGNMDILRDAGLATWDSSRKEWVFDTDNFTNMVMSGGRIGTQVSSGGVGRSGPPVGGMNRVNMGQGPNPAIQNVSQRDDFAGVGGYTPFQQELLETLERVSSKPSQDIGNQILEAIRERIEIGIPTIESTGTPIEQDRKTKWYRKLLSGSIQSTGRGIKNYFKFATNTVPNAIWKGFVQTPMRIMRGITDLPSRLGFQNNGIAQKVFAGVKGFKQEMGDLYITGKETAIIRYEDIKAGKYIDAASGRVIRGLKDIKGAIKDIEGNVVISEEDVKTKLYTLMNGKRFSIIGGALRTFGSAVTSLFSGALKANQFTATVAGKMVTAPVKLAMFLMKGVTDVYVAGEKAPRLLGSIMRNGGYFNRDGSVVKSVFDIKGDILDSTGEVVLNVADMSKGLLDKTGKPFKSLKEKIAKFVLAPAKLVKNAVVGMAKQAWKISTSPFRMLGKLGGRFAKMFAGRKDATAGEQVSAHMADTVDRIHDLLVDRLPRPKGAWNDKDGSGHRDGSREDVLLQRAKNALNKDDEKKAKEGDDKKDRKGIIGMLMAIAGGIGGVIGTIRGWATNIFTLMRIASQTKLMTSALDFAGAMAGRRGGRGGGLGKAAGAIAKSGMGKKLAIGAAMVGGLALLSRTSYGKEVMNGATSIISSGDDASYQDAIKAAGGSMGASSGGSTPSTNTDEEKLSVMDRFKNVLGGSALGEVAAIATTPLAMLALNKYRKSKGLNEIDHKGPRPTKDMGAGAKAFHWLTGTNKGRVAGALGLGAGVFAGKRLFGMDGGGESLAGETLGSYGMTLGLDAGLMALPLLMAKYGDKIPESVRKLPFLKGLKPTAEGVRQARQMAALQNAGINPLTVGAGRGGAITGISGLGAKLPGAAASVAPAVANAVPVVANATAPAAAKLGLGAGAKALGKGIFRNAGLLGTGYAAYDALTTEGSLADKGMAFGKSLLTTAAIGKGFSIGGQLMSAGGRAALMAGGKAGFLAAGKLGTMAAGAIGTALSSPVVLGGLALAAVGLGAWAGYKYFFGKDKNALIRFRMAQYGFSHREKEKVAAIGQLEQACQKSATVNGEGRGILTKNIKPAFIAKLFGLEGVGKEDLANFLNWFNNRFKPVFLNAFALYNKKTKQTSLEKMDLLPKEDKLELLDGMNAVSSDIFTVALSPFKGGKKLKMDQGEVASEYKRSKRKLNNEKGKDDKSMIDRVKDSFGGAWDDTKKTIKDAYESVKERFNNLPTAAKIAISPLAAGSKFVWGGMKAIGGAIGNAASTIGGTMSAAWKDTVGGVGFFKGSGGSAGDLPKPNGKGWKAVKETILGAAKMVGVEPSLMIAIAAVESGFDPNAKASTSSASGLFQFIKSTWSAMVSKHGNTYGIPAGTSPFDARANAVLGACYIRENAQIVKQVKGNVNATDVYMAHFLGGGGARTFLSALMKNPQASAPALMPKPAAANKTIFYKGSSPRSVAEVYTLMQNKLATQAKNFGVDAEYLNAIGGAAAEGSATSGKAFIPFKDAGQAAESANAANQGSVQSTGGSGGGGGGGGGGSGSGWFDYLLGGGGRVDASSLGKDAYGGGTNLVDAAKDGTVITSGDAAAFIKTIDPNLINLGKSKTKLADKDVDIAGMSKPFMVIFYGMIGEAVKRGIIATVQVNSANRSIEKQRQLYNAYIQNPKKNPMAAKPGKSRHNFGIAIDINSQQADKLANAGLLDKYGFTRPLLNHPRKPEPWHLESKYFTRGNTDTVKEVAKSATNAGNKAEVQKVTKEIQKANPIVQAEKASQAKMTWDQQKAAVVPKNPMLAGESKLMSLSSGFMAGQGPSVDTSILGGQPFERAPNIFEKQNTSKVSQSAAETTQTNMSLADQEHRTQMLSINQQQLDTQNQMLTVLHEIRDKIGGGGLAPSEAPKSEPNPAHRAAEMIRSKSREIPVSMSVKR